MSESVSDTNVNPVIAEPSVDKTASVQSVEETGKTEHCSTFNTFSVIAYCCVAASAGMNFSYTLGFPGYFHRVLTTGNRITHDDMGLYGSIITIGAVFGSLFSAFFVMGKFGRRVTLIAGSAFNLIGFAMHFALLNDFERVSIIDLKGYIIMARFISGFGVGMSNTAAPVYVHEVSPMSLFHYTAALYQIFIGTGFALQNTLAYIVDIYDVENNKEGKTISYYYAIICFPTVIIIVCAMQICCLCFMPKSPEWLVTVLKNSRKGKRVLAENVRKLYRSNYMLDVYYEKLSKFNVVGSRGSFFKSMLDSFVNYTKPRCLKAVLVVFIALFFQQYCGINPIVFNTGPIFRDAGVESETMAMIIFGYGQLIGSILALFALRYTGRKVLLVATSFGIFVIHLLLGLQITYFKTSVLWLPVLLAFLFAIVFSIGWGPIPFIYNSVLYPANAVSVASGIGIMFSWLAAFSITYPYFMLQDAIGLDGVFYFFSACMFLGGIYGLFLAPEIKGKTFDDVDTIFREPLCSTAFMKYN